VGDSEDSYCNIYKALMIEAISAGFLLELLLIEILNSNYGLLFHKKFSIQFAIV